MVISMTSGLRRSKKIKPCQELRLYFQNKHIQKSTHSEIQMFDPLAELKKDFYKYEKDSVFYNESYFHNMVTRETNRTYRLKSSFLLILIDISELMKQIEQVEAIEWIARSRAIDKLVKMLHDSTREVDIKGWFCENKVIGIICTDTELNSHAVVFDKLREKLFQTIDKRYADTIKISGRSFPDDKPIKSKTRVIPIKEIIVELYNEAAEIAAAKKGVLIIKRALDIVGSLCAIILFSPFFIILPVLIKLTSKGPVLFKHERVGRDGKTFQFIKFRSMYVNNDNKIHQDFIAKLIKGEIEVKEGEERKNDYKIKNDSRVTNIGKFIRKTSLDELPQFFNVLKGDMSLVGPRPPIAYEVERYDIWHTRRVINFKPGITGFWQVEGRSATTFDAMVRMDLRYIRKWSLWLDIMLLLKTPIAVFTTKGAC